MPDALQTLLSAYAQSQLRRATGGIYAMAGFAYQAEVAISHAVACLVASNDFDKAGQVFVEALSDIAVRSENGSLVLLQVKRTLTAAALDSAAEEVAAIESVDAAQSQPVRPCYGVICQHRSIDLDWARLPSTSPHADLVKRLQSEGRLQLPKQLPNPRWQALATLWGCHSDPFGFLRFALDRIVHRRVDVGDATACWEALAERYRQGLIQLTDCGQHLDVADVLVTESAAPHLEVGKRVTWDRWRRGQYMRRPVLAGDAARRALVLREQALQSPSTEMNVYWLIGRSGAGKSVVLLNVVSDLVQAGHSVLWLKPEELEPALSRIARSEDSAAPDFLAVDDIFDPDARDRIDLGRISTLIDERGARYWPVLLTCGPSEFADDFVEQSRFQGFSMKAHEVPLLDRAETERFVTWAAPCLGKHDPAGVFDRWSGLALSQCAQGQGLFVSVATELASGDMRYFGQRFASRLLRHGNEFVRRIRVCLAVNRLYLRAPATWLSREDRAHLEGVNRDNDFALDAVDAGQEWLRLTHPHLSDAIYPHLLKQALPRPFADDLGDAFEQALSGGYDALAQRLLLAFSAHGGQVRAQRMHAVDEKRLAERCVLAWRSRSSGGDIRQQAGMLVSFACWRAALPWLRMPVDDLIAEALRGIDQAEGQFAGLGWWPAWWRRLWAHYHGNAALVDWAVSRLANSLVVPQAAWSNIWEEVWHSAQGERREALEISARQWLGIQGHRADWHFVWKALHRTLNADRSSLVNLLVCALPHENGGHWAHVWQEALSHPPKGRDPASMILQGCDWLDGREDKEQWSYVWRALLSRAQDLPEGWNDRRLIKLGCDWLDGREDKEHWSYVWRALLSRVQDLPEGWSEKRLVSLGCDWLSGREGKDQWAFVWQALLEHVHDLPEGWSEQWLVKLGCDWLGGREDKEQWSYVWRALLSRVQDLPEGWSEQWLVKLGCDWLGGREDKEQWSYVWRELLSRVQDLPEDLSEQRLVSTGLSVAEGSANADIVLRIFVPILLSRRQSEVSDQERVNTLIVRWLPQLTELAPGPVSHALEAMLDGGLTVLPGVLEAARAWCIGQRDHKSWPLVLVKALTAWPTDPPLLDLAAELALIVQSHPNAGWIYKAQGVLDSFDVRDLPPALQQLVQHIRGRKDSPAWQKVYHWIDSGQEIDATVTAAGRQIVVELAGGMFAVLGRPGSLLRVGDSVRVVVTSANRAFDRIDVREALAPVQPPRIGDVIECTVTGFKPYGIFVRSQSGDGLILSHELPSSKPTWERLLPLKSKWKVQITNCTAKGFNGLIVAPPWKAHSS